MGGFSEKHQDSQMARKKSFWANRVTIPTTVSTLSASASERLRVLARPEADLQLPVQCICNNQVLRHTLEAED